MLVRCPKCDTGFKLPVDKIPAKGAKLRCSACTHAFRVRLDDNGKPEIVDKKALQNGDQTQIGGPLNVSAATSGEADAGSSTQFGIGSRSKSAEAGYNPFPLAGLKPEEANQTQLMGSNSSDVFDDEDDEEEIELFDDDLEGLDERSGQTMLGPSARAPKEGDRTTLGAAGRSMSQVGHPSDDVSGSATQVWGGGALDLFEGVDIPDDEAPRDLSADFDPFGDAFSDVGDNDLGLLMPSTPSSDDIAVKPEEVDELPVGNGRALGMSEESFLLGGQESEFGPIENLVDPSFGEDVAVFDPHKGAVGGNRPTPKKAAPSRRASRPRIEPDFDSAAPALALERPEPTTASPRPRAQAQPQPQQETSQPRPAARPAGGVAPHQIGAASNVRRFFDVVFITLVVLVSFTMFVAARSGWFVDFQRFGHMLEVAFEGKEFEPRPEWAREVEAEPAKPPPENPLRLENVRAWEGTTGKSRTLVVTGIVRNYSNHPYRALQIRAEVVDSDDKIVAEKTIPAGRAIDRSKIASAKTVAQLEKLVEEKVADVGKEGSIPFTVIFGDLPADKVEGGKLDYRVALMDYEK